MAEAEKVRRLEEDHRDLRDEMGELVSAVVVVRERVQDCRDDLGGKLDALATTMQDHAKASASAFSALDQRLGGLERDARTVRAGAGWLIRKAGPIVLAVALGAAAGKPLAEVVATLLAPALAVPVAPPH